MKSTSTRLLTCIAKYWSTTSQKVPGPKPLPILGNIWRYLPLIGNYKVDSLLENAVYNKNRYGSFVKEKLTSRHTIFHLFDPNDIRLFFRLDSKFPLRRSHRALLKYRHSLPELYQDGGLFPENGGSWYRQRTIFNKYLMSKSKVSSCAGKLDRVSLSIIKELESQLKSSDCTTIKNFEHILYKWALGNSLELFLDTDISQLDEAFIDQCIEQLHHSLQAIEKTEIHSESWEKKPEKCPHYRKLVDSQEFLYDLVRDKVKLISNEQHNGEEHSFLKEWLFVSRLDERDIISFIIDSLMAGFHTTSYTTAFLLYHIATNTDIKLALQKELDENLPIDEPLTLANIENLILLKNCLKETLRLNPVSIGTGRVAHKDLRIRGYDIPEGSMIITQNQAISLDEKIYSEPNLFKPNRWLTYRSLPKEDRPSPFATLPFGFGARSCIGQRIAELQIKILTIRILQRFDIVFEKEISTKTTLIHVLDGDFNLGLSRRSKTP